MYDGEKELLTTYKKAARKAIYYQNHTYDRSRYDYVVAAEIRLSELGLEVIHSPNFKATMTVISTIFNQRTKPEEEHTLFKRTRALKMPVKLTKNPLVPKLMAVGAPGFPEKVAIRLTQKFGGLYGIMLANDEDILAVEGMGKGLLYKLKKGMGIV